MAERISYLSGERLTPDPEPVRVGDIVKTGPNDYPRFEVIAIDSGRAWLRNVLSGEDAVISLDDCCWRVRDNGNHQRIGRLLRDPQQARVGPESPVEPTRIDRLVAANEPPSAQAQSAPK